MSLYDPHSNSTPSQRLAWAAHNARKTKIALRAKNIRATVAKIAEPEIVEPQPSSFSLWVARQERFNPLPKKRWFSVECEISPDDPVKPTIEKIQRVTANYYGLIRDDLICACRTKNLVIPRHVAMYLCRLLTLKSFPEIGRRFGNRDHTVPIYACNKIDGLIKTDPAVASDIEAIKGLLA